MIKKTNEQFEKELREKNNKVRNLEPYKGARTKITFQCSNCGYKWCTTPDSVLRGSGCARCAGILRKTKEELIEEVARVNPKIEVVGDYVNNRTRVRCRCKVCNHEWDADPIRLRTGTNCPNCVHSGTSFVEQIIVALFEDYYGLENVKNRDRTTINKELDIVVPTKRIAVEFGSWAWHKDKIDNDIRKIEACINNDIDVVIIYDSFDDSIELVDYSGHIITYSQNLGNDNEALRKMLDELMTRFNMDITISDSYFNQLIRRAYENARKRTSEEFRDEISRINPTINVIGEYTAARKKVECECLVCGHHWFPFADGILRGAGCPKCAYESNAQKQTLSHEEFIERIKDKLNPNVEIVGVYSNAHSTIKCKCTECGYCWDALPGDLHHGSGCPKCGGTMKRTHNEFIEELAHINKQIEILETYSNNKTPISCKCVTCGYEWKSKPSHLLAGHGCPRCSGNIKKTTHEIQEAIFSKGMSIDVIGDYINDNTPIHLKCQTCGYEWNQRARNLLQSRGCPNCFPYTEAQEKKWEQYYKYAQEYYNEHGDLNIPARAEYKGIKLGSWVYKQKEAYRNSLLPPDKRNKRIGSISNKRIELLILLGIKW